MLLPLGLILDVGHVGKPAPDHRDRGATAEGRVESDIALRYVLSAEAYASKFGVAVHVIQPGPAGMKYSERHREAVQVAQRDRSRRWLYLQCHLNSAERDPRYGLVGYDPRSAAGKRAAELLKVNVSSLWGMTESLGSTLTEPSRAVEKSSMLGWLTPWLCALAATSWR